MKVGDVIKKNQDDVGMLRRALERIIQLYTDKAHFVYELLQNAEDCGASNIKFEQFSDRLEVLHDGRPFTNDNLMRLCDIGLSDKENNLNQIGEFGVGFKSVFSICNVVRLYSSPSHYKGTLFDSVNPFAIEIHDFIRPYDIEEVSIDSNYTTKFVFPYHVGETYSGFSDLNTLRTTLADKLNKLGVTTLLFMKSLKEIHYNIYGVDKISGSYLLDTKPISDKCQLVSANGENAHYNSEENISYLKFTRQLQNSPRTVDIAFTVKDDGAGKFTCVKSHSPFISVYFPTGTESKVDFIVQAPFRTTPDRSSIPTDDNDNKLFAKELATLLKDSLEELKRLRILNVSFIQCLPIDERRFYSARLLYPLYEITESTLKNGKYLPSKNGIYISASEAKLTDSKQIAVLFSDELLTELIAEYKNYYWLPTEITDSNSEYRELYYYLIGTLKIGVVRPDSLRGLIDNNKAFLYNREDAWLVELYGFFTTIRAQFNRDGRASFVFSKIVKTNKGQFDAPYRLSTDKKVLPNIFIPSQKATWDDITFVDEKLYNSCKLFFDELLGLNEPDEYQSFVEYVKKTYGNKNFPEKTHIDDIKYFIKYMKDSNYGGDMLNLMRECLLLQCRNTEGLALINPYTTPVFFAKSPDGTQIETYYQNVFDNYYIDTDYYIGNGISEEMLAEFGIRSSIIKDGQNGYWHSYSTFCPNFDLYNIIDILKYISNTPTASDAILKSKIIFTVLKANENKLYDDIDCNDDESNYCDVVKTLRGYACSDWNGKWLYTNNLDLVSQKGISKRALNVDIYGKVDSRSKLYEILDFKKTAEDEIEIAEKEYDELPIEKQRAFFEIEFRRRFGTSTDEFIDSIKNGMGTNTPIVTDLYEFPQYNIRNWDTLKKHTTERFAAADPVKFERIVRTIRTSRTNDSKIYLLNMYRYDGTNKHACQLCHKSIDTNVNAVQIFTTPELELDPMHLCLCSKCMDDYHRMQRNDELMESLKNDLLSMDGTFIDQSNPVIIRAAEKELWFTQVHAAEIHELLVLMEDVKDCENQLKESVQKNASQPTNPEVVATYSQAILDKYIGLVGKRVKHKRQGYIGIVQSIDDNSYLCVFMETSPGKWQEIRYSIKTLESNNFLQIVEG